jgi:hypothetical protein
VIVTGINPVADIIIGITCAAFCFHIARISCASSWYLVCLSIIVLARLCVFGTAMPIKKVCFVFFIHETYVRSIRGYCFVRNYAAIPVQLEIVIGWCVSLLIVRTFVFNQFSCFCQFLMGSFRYPHHVSLHTL